jgi:hypothetical protein
MSFIPDADFQLESGEDCLTDYQFNKKAIHHTFCKVCGVKPFANGAGPGGPMVMLNLRCVDGVDTGSLTIKTFNGKDL